MAKSKNANEEAAKTTLNSKKSLSSPKSSKPNSPSTPKKSSDLIPYKIRLLDSEQKALEIFISKNADGQVLFNKVCDVLGGIVERDYFGLRYMDKNNQRQWLDLGRNVKKQMSGALSSALSFRVKHYPGNPIVDFHQEISLYLLYLQLRRDLVQGRLLCPLNELYTMGALILQSEYGDAPEDEGSGELNGSISDEEYKSYFKNFKIVFNQTKKIESEIIARHKIYRGLTARDAEVEVIKMASQLPTYGVDPFPVKIITKEKVPKKADSVAPKIGDSASNAIVDNKVPDTQSLNTAPPSPAASVYLGLRHTGLTTYVGLQPSETFECKSGSQLYIGPKYTQNYSWGSIERLACDGKDFIVYVKPSGLTESDETANDKPIQEQQQLESSNLESVEEGGPKGAAGDEKLSKSKKKKKVKKQQTPPKSHDKPAKPRVVTFRCDTKAAALALWKWTVDRQSFFTLKQASEAKTTKSIHGLFRRSHSYRFVGKSQMELKSIANSSESLPQPSFVRVSSLRRPKSHEGEFEQFTGRSTLPARIRTAEDGSYPMSDPVKRPPIPAANVEQAATLASDGVMNVANDLLATPESGVTTPIKEDTANDPVTILPVSVTPVGTAPAASVTPLSTDVDEVRQRTNHISKSSVRDSECLRAVNEIDQVIDSIQSSNGKTTRALPNGEVSSSEIKPSTSCGRTTGTTQSESISSNSMSIALKVAALIGVFCIGVMIAALETSHRGPGRQSNAWTELAITLRDQPIVASFNEYIYAPLRGFFVGRGH